MTLALVRVATGVRGHRLGEQLLLLRDVALDRKPELLVVYRVRAVRQGWEEATRELVFALRAGLEELEAPLDRELDRLIVAKLEVQVALSKGGTPVAAVERPTLVEVERARHRSARAVAR